MEKIMTQLFIVFIVIMIIKAIATPVNKKEPKGKILQYPYRKKELLTPTEQAFWERLKIKCNFNNLIVCPKVRLEDIAEVTDKSNKNKYRGYIKSRHIDFVICNNDLKIKAAIELDDYSHNNKNAKQTDEFKDKLFEKIGVKLYRIKVKKDYEIDINNIVQEISNS